MCTHKHGCESMNGCTVSIKVSYWKTCFVQDEKKCMRSVVWREREREKEQIIILRQGRMYVSVCHFFHIFTSHPFTPIEVLHTWGVFSPAALSVVISCSCSVSGTIVGSWHAEGISQCIILIALFSHPVL